MEQILLVLAYNPYAPTTNLTLISYGCGYGNLTRLYPGYSNTQLIELPMVKNKTGSISTLSNLTKIKVFVANRCYIGGDINTAFANMNKLHDLDISILPVGFNRDDYKTKYTGNISVFSDKYDVKILMSQWNISINGQVKDLKNLKKLYYIDFKGCSCTDSKTDLYNNGVNITTFQI